MALMETPTSLKEKLIRFYCNYEQIKETKEDMNILKDTLSELADEKQLLEQSIIEELIARDLEDYSYKDMLVTVKTKPNKISLSKEEKESEILNIVGNSSLDSQSKVLKILEILKPQETGESKIILKIKILKSKDIEKQKVVKNAQQKIQEDRNI